MFETLEEIVHAGVGSKLEINGNIYRIVYVRHTPVFRFTAEFLRKKDAVQIKGTESLSVGQAS
jgi:hypothetical protein